MGGCFFVEPDLCSSCVPIRDLADTPGAELLARRDRLEESYTLSADGFTLMGVHGMLSLALKHPGISPANVGGQVARDFRDQLGALLVEQGVLKADERAIIEHVEDPFIEVVV